MATLRSAWRVAASLVGAVLFLISLADVPEQIERWQGWLSEQGIVGAALRSALLAASGNTGRWGLALTGVALVLVVNHVPVILWRRIRPPIWKRYLEVDESGLATNELSAWGARGPPVAPEGRVIVDVTFRPEAQLGHRYDSTTGVFALIFDLRLEFVRKVLTEAASYFKQYAFEPDGGDMGFRYLRVKEFVAQVLAPSVIADIDAREKAQRKKDQGGEADLHEFGRCLEEWAKRLSPSHLDANFDPATLESLLLPRP